MEDHILEKVKQFADKAHGEQRRKFSKERYINHPVRVMVKCMKYTNDVSILSAALLHDVLEDTDVREVEMLGFLEEAMGYDSAMKTLKLVIELTDIYTRKNYPALNRRKRKKLESLRLSQVSDEAQTIKYADIIDNSINIAEHDPDFAIVFLFEGKNLLEGMQSGNPDLRAEAKKIVEESMRQVES